MPWITLTEISTISNHPYFTMIVLEYYILSRIIIMFLKKHSYPDILK